MSEENPISRFLDGERRDERIDDWSLKIRTGISERGVQGAREVANTLYFDNTGPFQDDDREVAYDIGASAGRAYLKSDLDYDEFLNSIQDAIPTLIFSRSESTAELRQEVEDGMRIYLGAAYLRE